ncbi:MAG: enolase C-terminal domain-like protein [Ignavibacteriota bacterium]
MQPDHGTSGGCRETKRIADYAYNRERMPTTIHMAGSPLATMAAAHTACTLDAFVAMECHAVDFITWWQDLITGAHKPFIDAGYVTVPDAPGLGVELNEPVIKEHLRMPGYFDPSTKWESSVTPRPWRSLAALQCGRQVGQRSNGRLLRCCATRSSSSRWLPQRSAPTPTFCAGSCRTPSRVPRI